MIPSSLAHLAHSEEAPLRLLHKFPAKSPILMCHEDPTKKYRTPCSMHVYQLDRKIPTNHEFHNIQMDADLLAEPTPTMLAFTFEALCRCANTHHSAASAKAITARLLFDTGASTRFVSLAYVEKHGYAIKPTHINWTVTVADNTTVRVLGTVDLHISINGYEDTVKLLVMPMSSSFDIVLGNDWAVKRQAVVNYRTYTLAILRKGKEFVLKPSQITKSSRKVLGYPSSPNNPTINPDESDTFVLSYMQAKRVLRKRTDWASLELHHIPETDTWTEAELLAALAKPATPPPVPPADEVGATEQPSTSPRPHNRPKEKPPPPPPPDPALAPEKVIRKAISRLQAGIPDAPAPINDEPTREEQEENEWLEDQIARLVASYGDSLFRDELPGVRQHGEPVTAIPIQPGTKPTVRGMGRYGKQEREELDKQVHTLLKSGLIEPSLSPYAAAALIVPKYNPDNTIKGWRMVIDYRMLNAVTIKYQFPMPRVGDVLDSVNGAQHFSAMDATSGFWQMRLHPDDVPKTAFRTPSGLYQWRVLPQGLSNSPAVFQRNMASFFQKVYVQVDGTKVTALGTFIQVYMDDLLVYSKTAKEHLDHLKFVLDTLKMNGIFLNAKKCEFNKSEVRFLGHLVSRKGVRPDPAKVSVMKDWPKPEDRQEMYRFLGFANYFRQFIRDYATIASPLYPLTQCATKEDFAFQWTDLHQSCFEALKLALAHAPTLKLPDFDKPFEVIVDASNIAVGAVLLQENRPVAYESKKLTPTEARWTTTEREMYAAVHALKQWRCYLQHPTDPFTLWTDHNPNTYFSTTHKPLSARQARWQEFLGPFHFHWKYKKGEDNIADALSRLTIGSEEAAQCIEATLAMLSIESFVFAAAETRSRRKASEDATRTQPTSTEGASASRAEEVPHGPAELVGTQPRLRPALVPSNRPEKRIRRVVSFDPSPPATSSTPPTNVGDPSDPSPRGASQPPNAVVGDTATPHPNTGEQPIPPPAAPSNDPPPVDPPIAPATEIPHPRNPPSHLTSFQKELWSLRNHAMFQLDKRERDWVQDRDGLWKDSNDRYVLPTVDIRRQAMHACHDTVFSGHMGRDRTGNLIQRLFYWPRMMHDIEAYCKNCPTCQTVKANNHKPYGKLFPLPVPQGKWTDVTVDLITGLPLTAHGFNAICVFVDRMTKMVHLVPCKDTLTAPQFCELFARHIIALHGSPVRLVSDRGSIFAAQFTTAFTANVNCLQKFSTAYHPETDGQTERANRVIEDVLRSYVDLRPETWDTYLPMAEFAMNNAPNKSTGNTPFMLNYGVNPRHPDVAKLVQSHIDGIQAIPAHRNIARLGVMVMEHTFREVIPDIPAASAFTSNMRKVIASVSSLVTHAENRHPRVPNPSRTPETRRIVHASRTLPRAPRVIHDPQPPSMFADVMRRGIEHTQMRIDEARTRMVHTTDAHRDSQPEFKVGDNVMLSTKNIKLQLPVPNKLLPRFVGPFTIDKVVGERAFRLTLPPTMRIHNVFHVNLLRRFHPRDFGEQPHPPPLVINGDDEYEVEALLGKRDKVISTHRTRHTHRRRTQVQFLVKWAGYGHEHNQWIPEVELTRFCQRLIDAYNRDHPS